MLQVSYLQRYAKAGICSATISTLIRPVATLVSGNFTEDRPLNYYGGKRVKCVDPTEKKFHIEEPASGKRICEMQECGQKDVDLAVQSAKEAQKVWGELDGFERSKILKNAAELVKKRKEEFARVEVFDTGKPINEARVDIQTCIDSLDYFGSLATIMSGEHHTFSNGSFGYTRREPLGVVCGIGAWNYPIQMAGWKTAPSLAGGNSIVFKPSEFTPLTAVMLGEALEDSGVPKGLYNVVQGGATCGSYLTSHPDVAKVTFTGSVPSGSKVMASCAQGIKAVTLELGGKSPLIIFEDCDIDNAVNHTLMANYATQGQVCSNGTRVYIHKDIYEAVVDKLVKRTRLIKHGDPHLEDTVLGSMINKQHAQKVLGFITRAQEEGAEVLCGGELVKMEEENLEGGSYISPCIIKPGDDMEITREEVFGPVMNVYSFSSEEEVLGRANDTHFGLASGIFTKDLNKAHRMAAKLQAGNCYINSYNMYPMQLPFGGYKKSGLGKENGIATMEAFTQLKSVYVEAGIAECPYPSL